MEDETLRDFNLRYILAFESPTCFLIWNSAKESNYVKIVSIIILSFQIDFQKAWVKMADYIRGGATCVSFVFQKVLQHGLKN